MDRTFDRVPQFDEKSRAYPIRELIGTPVLREKRWRILERLDQGQEGACVGFGWCHELHAPPIRITNVDPRAIYKRAQQLDPWPGEDYEGTSVLAGAQAVQELGHLKEYRWAFGIDDVLATLVAHGPVVIGVNWHQGMSDTDPQGYIHPVGPIRGGHCVCLMGIIRRRRGWVVIGRNSWGIGWGRNGNFRITADDLAYLLSSGGDACIPVIR